MNRSVVVVAIATLALLIAGCGEDGSTSGGSGGQVTVAAAADLRPAFTELGKAFEQQTGIHPVYSFGSSGQLAQQVINGAPFALFASASVGYVDDVIDAGRGDANTKATYAFGRIVVWASDRKYTLDQLAAPSVGKVAIANPEHAPYGVAAQQALKRAGVWDAVEPKLVLGENVSDTQQLAKSGNAGAAIISLSLAVASDGRYTMIPRRLYQPLEQALVVVGDGEGAARARRFARFLGSADGRAVMRRYGFLLPGDQLPAAATGG